MEPWYSCENREQSDTPCVLSWRSCPIHALPVGVTEGTVWECPSQQGGTAASLSIGTEGHVVKRQKYLLLLFWDPGENQCWHEPV